MGPTLSPMKPPLTPLSTEWEGNKPGRRRKKTFGQRI